MANVQKITIQRKAVQPVTPQNPAPQQTQAQDLRTNNIVPLQVAGGSPDNKISDVNIPAVAKGLEPLVDSIIGMADGAGVRLLKQRAGRLYDEEKTERFADSCHMSEETRNVAKKSLSRIAARRVKNEEVLDFIALGGAFAEWSSGIMFALAELKGEQVRRDKVSIQPKQN